MGAGGVSCGSDQGDDIVRENSLPDRDENVRTMAVSRICIRGFMVKKHLIPITVAVVAGLYDDSVKQGRYGGSVLIAEIYAGMEGIFAVDGMVAPSET